MKVVEISEPGPPHVLRLADRPDPEPGPKEVLVRVHASGLNRADLLQRLGRYPPPTGFPPEIPGLEVAGKVVRLGEGVTSRKIGDRVMAIVGGGGYAELVPVPEGETIRIPAGMPFEAAAGVPEAFVTAWDALVLQGRTAAGETVLVHAVGSGVGTAALQIARHLGAHVLGTSRTPEKLERAAGLGLEGGVLARGEADWGEEVMRLTAGRGVDVILDLVGAEYLAANLKVLASRGRWLLVGVPGGSIGTIDLRALMAKRGTLIGTVLRTRTGAEKSLLAREFERALVPLFEQGILRPVLDRSFAARDAGQAHGYLEENRSFGTVVLSWGG
jgi:putative PIG3 family NAD(P)H quinone oxidoreductase